MTTSTKRMETISDLVMGKPQAAANLVMVPLSGNPAAALSYILVDEALRKKEVVVEEVSEGGAVPDHPGGARIRSPSARGSSRLPAHEPLLDPALYGGGRRGGGDRRGRFPRGDRRPRVRDPRGDGRIGSDDDAYGRGRDPGGRQPGGRGPGVKVPPICSPPGRRSDGRKGRVSRRNLQ